MNEIIISTAYLPPIEYIKHILRAEKVFLENCDTYAKQTYRNRCVIASPNGKQNLVIPIIHLYKNMKICDVKIDYSSRWNVIHWRSIVTAYNNSPFFMYYKDFFEPFYFTKYKYLLDFNNELLQLCLNLLKIKKELFFTDVYDKQPLDKLDFRNSVSPKNKINTCQCIRYPQVFEDKNGFIPNLSIIDLLFNRGNDLACLLDNS